VAYFMLEDFASGIDHRKSAVTAKAGSLRVLNNAYVNAGGEIEKRRKFQLVGSVPASTHGLSGNPPSLGPTNETLEAVATVYSLSSPVTVPSWCRCKYVHLNLTPGYDIVRILDNDVFARKEYVIIRLTDYLESNKANVVHHFMDYEDPPGTLTPQPYPRSLYEHYTKERTDPPDNPSYQLPSTAKSAKTHRTKMYLADGDHCRFSAVNDANSWSKIYTSYDPPTAPITDEAVGAGFIDVTAEDTGRPELIGLEAYYNYLALFGKRTIQVWSMDPNPLSNQLIQTLGNTGLVAPYALARYGNGDVLFLSDTGIRSVRARDSSNAAILNDIGSPIDSIIQARRLTLTDDFEAEKIKGLVDPLSGHFWLVWGSTVYVMAYYPATKVTAWSTFELPFTPDYSAQIGSRLAFRAGNDVYIYGHYVAPATAFSDYPGLTSPADEYDATVATIETPMLDFGKPAHWKQFVGLDAALEGTWSVYVNFDPLAPGAWVLAATLTQPTFSLARITLHGGGTHIAIRLVSSGGGRHRVGSLAIHHNMAEGD